MRKWPTSAAIALSATLIGGVVAVHQTYLRTKAAWYAAGQTNGSISAQIDLIDRLRQNGVIGKCAPASQPSRALVVSVKTDSIYLTDDQGARRLCE